MVWTHRERQITKKAPKLGEFFPSSPPRGKREKKTTPLSYIVLPTKKINEKGPQKSNNGDPLIFVFLIFFFGPKRQRGGDSLKAKKKKSI